MTLAELPTAESTTADATRSASAAGGRQRRVEVSADRVRRDGKFFRIGADKFFVKGVTYGPFAPGEDGQPFASPELTAKDFAQIRELGANCVRVYHVPPPWFLDLAESSGVKVLVDVAWPKNLTFTDNEDLERQAHDAVRSAAERCGNHPATFAISVVNEIPPDIVRFSGAGRVEELINALVRTVKASAPQCLVTFANFPSTEYLNPREIDFVCFNVYLHDAQVFRNYLARLQSIAGERPLVLGEYGIDTHREYPPERQAEILAAHVRAVFDEGCVGTFIFSFTDDWNVHGHQIEDWAFGITRRERDERGYRIPKPAFGALKPLLARVPQLSDEPLPKASVVICSYNGASTVETCLRSMERLRYHLPDGTPNYEVIFVDDGSKDHTQEILKKFPWVKNIRQKNMGLSYARNVGMNNATGEVIVYTDSDCEADEDWLYYFCLALVRGSYGGMGGPNLIPDEGSWIADCVGLSPGGPTHVMIDDRTAEHVPGCNMGFWAHVLRSVNGFDPQFRKAGDDVDVIWRIQNLGYAIGFSPAAQVWHYRRNTMRAYLNQQRGYGEAEALLKYKHPDHFNTLGASHWRGRIYGGEAIGVRFGGDTIYHGIFGTGLFQTIYRRPASLVAAMLMSIEWHLLYAFVFVLGLALPPLLWLALGMAVVPIALAVTAAYQVPMPRHRHPMTRMLIALLHYRQPIVRGWARYTVRLKNKGLTEEARGYVRPSALPLDPAERRTLRYWHGSADRLALLEAVRREVAKAGWKHGLDSGWRGWDMEIYGSRYVKVRLLSATENHHANGRLTRVRVSITMSNFCRVLLAGSVILAVLLLLHVWPFSRPAVLLPMIGWGMYLMNKWRVSAPVLGLIDKAAEDAGFWPVDDTGRAYQRDEEPAPASDSARRVDGAPAAGETSAPQERSTAGV